MPILDLECRACGGVSEEFVHSHPIPACTCGGERFRRVPTSVYVDGGCSYDYERLTPGERQAAYSNKKSLESPKKQAMIRSGELEYRPGKDSRLNPEPTKVLH